MRKGFIFFLVLQFLLLSCAQKVGSSIYGNVDDTPDNNKNDSENKLPEEETDDHKEVPDKTDVEPDVETVDDFIDDDTEENDIFIANDDDENSDSSEKPDDDTENPDILITDDDVNPFIEPCFEKKCSLHDECSVEDESCTPFFPMDIFACGPDNLEDFGYRGKEQCLLINCEEDSDCQGSEAYVCIHFSSAVPELLDATSVCVRSLSGSECFEEGKRVCQYGKNVVLECTEGKWKPYICSSKSFCEDGQCKPIIYPAKMVISVDDLLVNLCVNGNFLSPLGPNKGSWIRSDEYHFNLVPGINVIGVHGRDTGKVVSAFMATVEVAGELYVTDGVMPPDDGVEYNPTDPEWNATPWRYFPEMVGTPRNDWCDRYFDDSGWGPAIRAGTATTPIDEWGHLGAHPWVNPSCGYDKCPGEFLHYYEDEIPGNEPMWVWDYKPVDLNDAWFRLVITMP